MRQAVLSVVLLITLIYLESFWKPSRRRRETDVKATMVATLVALIHAAREGEMRGTSSASTMNQALPDLWRFIRVTLPSSTAHLKAYPARLCLLSCISIKMMFYNLMLALHCISWDQWNQIQTKLVCPTLDEIRSHDTFQDSFDKDDPQPRYIKPSAERRQKRARTPYKRMLLAALTALNSTVHGHHTFELQSQSQLTNALRKHRCFQGMLRTDRIGDSNLKALQQVIALSNDNFQAALGQSDNALDIIIDSGASFTCGKSEDDFVPGTLKKLPKPLPLGGIAGDLTVEYEGIVRWETLDDFGNECVSN